MMPGQEVPQRIKIVEGHFTPLFPEECEPHTPEPIGAIGNQAVKLQWIHDMLKTHIQRQCKGCGLWAIFDPMARKEGDDG
jgi:hypothetical protein